MASNSATITDPDFNNYADWIEIYNAGTIALNLRDYFITDNLSQPQKFKIQVDLIVAANSYVLLWADDANTGKHTNFKLSASGESIGLFNPAAQLIDTITFGLQQTDISAGRFPNGTNNWFKFSPSTPGSKNLEVGILNLLPKPEVSHISGFYESPFAISFSHSLSGVTIRYTTDGTLPIASSYLYSTPLQIDSTSVIRVRAFKEDFTPSLPITRTYFINEQSDLPVFSIVTDPANFFSDTAGIYVAGTNGIIGYCSTTPKNWNQDWERPVHIDFFENDKSLAFEVNAGVQIYGGCSRLYPMKSLALYFRGEYGNDKLQYRLFDDIQVNEFNNFILRSSGQDWWRTMFRDAMAQTLIEQGMNLDYQDYRPAVLFINGDYWGIHNLREKLNEHYVYYHHGVNKDNIDLIEISKGIFANNGDLTAYNDMINFLSTNNMSLPANYDYIKSITEIDEYIDYQVAEIYSANGDWPGSNVKLWRERTPSAKWRWMIYDLDFTFGGNAQGQYNTNTLAQATAINGPSWPNPPWSTLMFRKLLENSEFKEEFIQRFAAHLNTTFERDHIITVIDSLSEIIASEIPRHKQRWPQSISYGTSWQGNIQIMRDFAADRPAEVRNHLISKFNITGTKSLTVNKNNPEWGRVYTNSVEIKKNGSVNIFFTNIPLKIKAVALPGYRFVRWEGISNSTSSDITIFLINNSTLSAIFEAAELSVTSVVINEINYKSSPIFDTEDWVEFYNPIDQAINISGWKFKDDNASNYFIFPEGAVIGKKDYLILCKDTSKFKLLYPNEIKVMGNLLFGLSSDGEHIQLLDNSGNMVDEVNYSSTGAWSSLPNGNGPTLSLINPQFDNSLPQNWKASQLYGTPGRLNDVYTKVDEDESEIPNEFLMLQNYPNPFNPVTQIRYTLPQLANVQLKIYDILGREVKTLVNSEQPAGAYRIEWNGTNNFGAQVASGMYMHRIVAGKFVQTKKMMFLK